MHNRKEDVIKRERTFEATRNNLMGIGGKLGIICKHLGKPIQKEGGSMFDTSEMDDLWLLEDDEPEEGAEFDMNKMPMMDEEEISYTIGYVFDGLSRGMHLEIKYLEDRKELNCYYKGFEVYKEVNGELEAYAPSNEWEEKIEYLFSIAKKTEKKRMQQKHEVVKEMAAQKHAEYLEHLKNRWGFQ